MFRNPVTDLIIVAVVALLILGPKRLPMLGRSLGQGMREFKEGITGDSKPDADEERPALTATAAPAPAAEPTPPAAPAAAPVTPAPAAESAEAPAADRSA
jgi:sec-independent protein translocase protein TatA